MGQGGSVIRQPTPPITDVCGALERGEATEPAQPAVPNKFQRLSTLGHLEVDADIARGLSLQKSLRTGGRLWLTCPADLDKKAREELWNRSHPVKHFDLFLSHTWMTPGKWKLLSLLLQSGSHKTLFFWLVGVSLAAALSILDLVPLPWVISIFSFGFDRPIPVGPWILLASFVATMLGLFASPYFPRPSRQTDMCFLDLASIHQADAQLMERGIYGIGGFLSISSELRVLWSAPYLSRLWCVFELAAYRTANPTGKITLTPLFVELIVCLILLMQYVYCGVWWMCRTWREEGKYRLVSHGLAVVPSYFVMHVLRKAHVLKHTLFSELESFDISKAKCSSDFDKTFIRTAIAQWYGSEEAFTDFVRGPLREELRTKARCCTFLDYELLLLTPLAASGLTSVCGAYVAGAPPQVLASQVISCLLGLALVWARLCMKLCLYLCDRFAKRRWHDIRDYGQTFLLFVVFAAVVFLGVALSATAHSTSLGSSVAFLGFGLLCNCGSSMLTRMSWRL